MKYLLEAQRIAEQTQLRHFVYRHQMLFRTRTSFQHSRAAQYIQGLLQSHKRNMERMCEYVPDSAYHQIQHFISESPWDHRAVMDTVADEVNQLLSGFPLVGLLIDESAHPKKGNHSVGVARQYCGTTGKVDNCQVAVYAALSADKYYGVVDTELFLPETWVADHQRCRAAGIPQQRISFKTKPQLALQMIERHLKRGTRFEYVVADALYGNDPSLAQALDTLGVIFVFEVHKDQHVYLSQPDIAIPPASGNRGRKPSRYKTTTASITVEQFYQQLDRSMLRTIVLRQGSRGPLSCKAIALPVYVWDGHSPSAQKRMVVIRVSEHRNGSQDVVYCLTNAPSDRYSVDILVQMQAQRHRVEESFREVKQESGMSQYQVRGWLAWYHHMALVILVQLYI